MTLRLIVRRSPNGHQSPILTNRSDLSAAQVAYRMGTRWRQENYFKYARQHFALDALDSYADQPDDPDRLVPTPPKPEPKPSSPPPTPTSRLPKQESAPQSKTPGSGPAHQAAAGRQP